MADMRSIATAWEARATDTNGYTAAGATITWPDPTLDVTVLTTMLVPTYIKKFPDYDGWGTRFQVGYDARNYAIESLGADRTDHADGTSASAPVTTNDFDCDILFSLGNFLIYPDGIQQQ
jgi:hypothetical protein